MLGSHPSVHPQKSLLPDRHIYLIAAEQYQYIQKHSHRYREISRNVTIAYGLTSQRIVTLIKEMTKDQGAHYDQSCIDTLSLGHKLVANLKPSVSQCDQKFQRKGKFVVLV